MALTIDKLKQDTTIAGANIPDSVLTAIANLSKNEEDSVIAARDGHIYGLIDTAFEEATGIKKPTGVKTTDFIKAKAGELKTTAEKAGNVASIEKERDDLKAEVVDLKKKITDGNTDAVLKQRVTELEAQIKQKEADITNLTKTKEEELAGLKSKLDKELSTNVELALMQQANDYFSKLKFDPKLPTWAIEAKKREAIEAVRQNKGVPALEGDGVNRGLVFKDKDGNVMKKANDQLKPYTFGDLAEEYVKDAVVAGGGGGGGTTPPGGGGGGGTGFSIAGMRSQQEVTTAIRQHLSDAGVAVTDEDYQTKFDELYATEGVSDLPINAK